MENNNANGFSVYSSFAANGDLTYLVNEFLREFSQ